MAAKKKTTHTARASFNLEETEEKAKKVTPEEAAKKESSVINQIVEIIEENAPADTTVDITEKKDDTVVTVDIPSPEAPQEEAHEEKIAAPEPEPLPEERPETDKSTQDEASSEVISEIFQKPQTKSVGYPEISMHKPNKRRALVLWAIVVIIAALVVGGGLMFSMGQGTGALPTIVMSPTETPTPTETAPTPTPAAEVDKADIVIEVLNGGGVVGAGSKMRTALEDAGYTVESVGNADEYTYTETLVLVKEGEEATRELVVADLEGEYTIGESEDVLPDDSEYDVQVIVGSE